MDTTIEIEVGPECVRYECGGNIMGYCEERAPEYPCRIAGLLLAKNPTAKKMPVTLEDFRRAALWLGRKAASAGNILSACLAGPAPDDAENGICIGYRDGRDLV